MCEPQGGLCRVEESKPGSFLSLLIWRNFGVTFSPIVIAQDQTREQAVLMTESHVMLSPCLFSSSAHTAPDHPPALAVRGPCLHSSLGQFNQSLHLNQYNQISRNVDVQ